MNWSEKEWDSYLRANSCMEDFMKLNEHHINVWAHIFYKTIVEKFNWRYAQGKEPVYYIKQYT